MADFLIMKITGASIDILCEMKPDYNEYMVTEAGVKTLYGHLIKACYGCIKSALLLWYDLFTESLKGMGFIMNPYGLCMANNILNWKQCMIVWYIDNNKISHIDPEVVTSIIEKIGEKLGKMTMSQQQEYTFLGIDIVCCKENGTVVLQMCKYLEDTIVESEICIKRSMAMPAKKNLFDVDLTAPFSSKPEVETFHKVHKVAAKILYGSKPDDPWAQKHHQTRTALQTKNIDFQGSPFVLTFQDCFLNLSSQQPLLHRTIDFDS